MLSIGSRLAIALADSGSPSLISIGTGGSLGTTLMAEHRTLENPPLREAIIDIRVNHASSIDASRFADLAKDWLIKYPIHEKRQQFSGQIKLGPGPSLDLSEDVETTLLGSLYYSEDRKLVVQARIDGFTFSRLDGYTDWDDLFPEAMRLWSQYVEIAQPNSITRLAARYINDLRFKTPLTLEEVLTSPPSAPTTLPSGLVSFLTQVTVFDEDTSTHVTISQALGGSDVAGLASIILDIDTFQLVELTNVRNMEALSEHFSVIRTLKNAAFFGSVTDEALRRLQ